MPRTWISNLCGLLLLSVGNVVASPEPAQLLQLFNREQLEPLHVNLTQEQWHWLREKGELRVATWAPDNPPFDIIPEPGIYEGIYADYIKIMSLTLGVRVQVMRFVTRADAMRALQNNSVDMVVDDAGSSQLDANNFIVSNDFISNRPVLVTRENLASHIDSADSVIKLAVAYGYLYDQQIIQHFKNAEITRFPSSQSALACVALSKCDYFLGNLTSASYLIERNYSNKLTITDIFPAASPGAHFVLRSGDALLKNAINTVLQVIPVAQHRVISRQWVQRQDIWRFETPLLLTQQEQRWINKNPKVRVVVNPFFAPYSMVDDNGDLHGIGADILRLIHLRTGINFEISTADSADSMLDLLENDKADMIAATSFSHKREQHALFPRAWQPTPGVLVVRNTSTAPTELNNNLTLVTVKGNALAEQLAGDWPGIRWEYATNESLALQMVNAGRADGAVSNQLGANYLIDRYFRGELRIAIRLSETPTLVGFAVRRNAPELLDIINKAQAEILPQEISLIVHKWQGTPEIPLNTWRLYSSQFYWLLLVAGGLILSALFWMYTRDKERKRLVLIQHELQEQLVFRDTLLNGSPTPIYVLSKDLSVLMHNDAWLDYFKQFPTESLNHSLHDLRHPLSRIRESLSNTIIMRQQEAAQEFVISNGVELRTIAHWATPFLDVRGEVQGLICGWQDITVRNELLQALSVEKDLAEQANQAKSVFLATMSHEIRTPISAILGLLELEARNQPSNEAIKVSFESAQTLMGIIGDVLDMAKIEGGQLELFPEWIRIGEVILPVIRLFEEVARQKNLVLRFVRENDEGMEIFVDGSRLRQVVANYLSNAVKFTNQGSIDVRLYSQRISPDSLLLRIEVKDTGVGVSLKDQKRLFKPFVQLEEGRKQTGTGLGLVISSQLLEKMHGNMQMQSTPGEGTTILIDIPVSVRQAHNAEVSDNARRLLPEKPLSILIVDDHPANRMVLERQLTMLGHLVTEAKSGQEAIALWSAATFDLIITDCTMPEMDGFTLTRKLRATGNGVKIIGLTGNAQTDTREKGIAAGMDECLFKPLRLSQLESALRSVAKTHPKSELQDLVNLEDLAELLHNDEAMMAQLLLRICDENDSDISDAWRCYSTADWHALAACMHKIAGAAQVIYAPAIDELSTEIEGVCESTMDAREIKQLLKVLEDKIHILHRAIRAWLRP